VAGVCEVGYLLGLVTVFLFLRFEANFVDCILHQITTPRIPSFLTLMIVSSYQEFLPHPHLRLYIEAYWRCTVPEAASVVSYNVFPDCCADIIINLRRKTGQSRASLVGTMTTFLPTSLSGGDCLLGIRFKPAGLTLLCDVPLQGTSDIVVDEVPRLFTTFLVQQERALHSADWQKTLDAFFLSNIPVQTAPILTMVSAITQKKGLVRVQDITSAAAINERRLERLFHQHIGVSPRTFCKLVRFHAAFTALAQKPISQSLLDFAWDYGYYDNAHLTNDFKKYTGQAPSLFSPSVSDSSKA
jgi:AraC-like DNA-binding protein